MERSITEPGRAPRLSGSQISRSIRAKWEVPAATSKPRRRVSGTPLHNLFSTRRAATTGPEPRAEHRCRSWLGDKRRGEAAASA